MNDKQFDDIIKNRLKSHESAVPANMWQRITGDARKRRSGFFLRLFSIVILLLLLGFVKIYYFAGRNEPGDTKEKKNANAITTNRVNKSVNKTETVKKEETDAGIIVNSLNSTIPIKAVPDNLTKSDVTVSTPTVHFNTGKRSNSQKGKGTSLRRRSAVLASSGKRQGSKEMVADLVPNNERNNDDSTVVTQNKRNNLKDTDSTVSVDSDRRDEQADKLYVEFFTGPAIPVNKINASSKDYEQLLRSGASRLSFTVGARFKYEFTKRISAKIGLQYTQMNEKMVVENLDPTRSFSSINRYKNVGVPLQISYKTAALPHLPVSINTGIILNISSRASGIIPSQYGQPINIKIDDVYTRNTSVQLYLSFDLSKRLGDRTDLFAEPWFGYSTKNMVNRMYAFEQKMHGVGVAFGIRYTLFKIDNP